MKKEKAELASTLNISDLVCLFAEHIYMLRLKSQKFTSQLVLVEQVALRRGSCFVTK